MNRQGAKNAKENLLYKKHSFMENVIKKTKASDEQNIFLISLAFLAPWRLKKYFKRFTEVPLYPILKRLKLKSRMTHQVAWRIDQDMMVLV